MEIEIKTLDEARDGRVQVTITVDGAMSTDPARRLYTSEEVGALQASEAELVAAPLRREIGMLKLDVAELENKVEGYDQDRHTERDRADQNMQRAIKAESELETCREALVQALNDRKTAYRQLANISRAVAADRPHMRCTVEGSNEDPADWSTHLAEAIRDIRAITSPWADPPTSRTSQA